MAVAFMRAPAVFSGPGRNVERFLTAPPQQHNTIMQHATGTSAMPPHPPAAVVIVMIHSVWLKGMVHRKRGYSVWHGWHMMSFLLFKQSKYMPNIFISGLTSCLTTLMLTNNRMHNFCSNFKLQ